MFGKHHAKEQLTVEGAARQGQAANGVDTTVKSTRAALLRSPNQGEKPRAITSGDIGEMFKKHAEAV